MSKRAKSDFYILIAEDIPAFSKIVADRLREEGYVVSVVSNGREALASVEMKLPDLILLDIVMPEMDGREACKRLRRKYPSLYIIMLTALDADEDKLLGYQIGADDYVTKQKYSLREVVARIDSVFERDNRIEAFIEDSKSTLGSSSNASLNFGNIIVNLIKRKAYRSGELVELSPREFDLLCFFVANANQFFTRQDILSKVWAINDVSRWDSHNVVVDKHVSRLRRVFDDDPSDQHSLFQRDESFNRYALVSSNR